MANRLSSTEIIDDVQAQPADEKLIVDQITFSGQIFKARISGGTMNTKTGIRFLVTTRDKSVREFDVTLPVAPAGIVGSGNVGSYVIGNTGPVGPRGRAGTITIGEVTASETDGDAQVTNIADNDIDVKLNFVLPRGKEGEKGVQGDITEVLIKDTDPEQVDAKANIIWLNNDSGDLFQTVLVDDQYEWKQNGNLKGNPGSIIYSDYGNPIVEEKYKPGDIYINLSTSELFNLDQDQWIAIASLKGDKGDQGERGSLLSAGEGEPLVTEECQEQDLYLNTTTNQLFIFEDSQWKETANLQGEVGPKGDTPIIEVGTVTEGEADVTATTDEAVNTTTFNFVIPKGDKGDTPIIEVGTVTEGEADVTATTDEAANTTTFNFVIPKGDKGDTSIIEVGTVTEGEADVTATTDEAANTTTFNFVIPKGDKGEQGDAGFDGTRIIVNTVNPTEKNAEDNVVWLNSETGELFESVLESNGLYRWNKLGNLKGNAGSHIYSGLEAPSVCERYNVDDLYLNTTSSDLLSYNGNQWVKISNLQGERGERGSLWSSGEDNPVFRDTYKSGDFYLNTATFSVFYFNGTYWESRGSIKGVNGLDGKNGASIITSQGDPEIGSADQNQNVIWINTLNWNMKRTICKNGAWIWIDIGNIQGEQGNPGQQGEKGDSGARWYSGTIVPDALTGVNDKRGKPRPGDMYLHINDDDHDVSSYILTDDHIWEGPIATIGVAGPPGKNGVTPKVEAEVEMVASDALVSVTTTEDADTNTTIFKFFIPQGAEGAPGSAGSSGTTPVIQGGSVTMLDPGASASVSTEDIGDNTTVFNFSIPIGSSGTTPVIQGGSVTMLDPGASASVSTEDVGDNTTVFNFSLPKANDGKDGAIVQFPEDASMAIEGNVYLNKHNQLVKAQNVKNVLTPVVISNQYVDFDYPPTVLTKGAYRYNTTTQYSQIYDGYQWRNLFVQGTLSYNVKAQDIATYWLTFIDSYNGYMRFPNMLNNKTAAEMNGGVQYKYYERTWTDTELEEYEYPDVVQNVADTIDPEIDVDIELTDDEKVKAKEQARINAKDKAKALHTSQGLFPDYSVMQIYNPHVTKAVNVNNFYFDGTLVTTGALNIGKQTSLNKLQIIQDGSIALNSDNQPAVYDANNQIWNNLVIEKKKAANITCTRVEVNSLQFIDSWNTEMTFPNMWGTNYGDSTHNSGVTYKYFEKSRSAEERKAIETEIANKITDEVEQAKALDIIANTKYEDTVSDGLFPNYNVHQIYNKNKFVNLNNYYFDGGIKTTGPLCIGDISSYTNDTYIEHNTFGLDNGVLKQYDSLSKVWNVYSIAENGNSKDTVLSTDQTYTYLGGNFILLGRSNSLSDPAWNSVSKGAIDPKTSAGVGLQYWDDATLTWTVPKTGVLTLNYNFNFNSNAGTGIDGTIFQLNDELWICADKQGAKGIPSNVVKHCLTPYQFVSNGQTRYRPSLYLNGSLSMSVVKGDKIQFKVAWYPKQLFDSTSWDQRIQLSPASFTFFVS
ncbi:hypothetical protein CIN_13550 [Commensalibacter intestini A911]|uniref:Uncharacterized protein n=2 Tax=Commensalibacter intestini TaxID=479936 RepID=G6F0C4_9PROT|nr:hypothetical protein CIN_13550 [Commensalibacter intestini A911]